MTVLPAPPASSYAIASALSQIGDAIDAAVGEAGYGSKYGQPFDGDTFQMHPYCWCERSSCPWCLGCACPSDASVCTDKAGNVIKDEQWYSLADEERGPEIVFSDKLCGNCRDQTPRAVNFYYAPLDWKLNWYKYIGRSMEANKPITSLELARMLTACLEEISAHPDRARVPTTPARGAEGAELSALH